ncbi:hypothetical protein NQ318_014628 [Aromia moschata]|uniref:Transposase n=1 Tax=Aromia moschata TaxID=1265417 RepID=A0AAV8ZDE2_9CUCU|nr:hypothetical protein NQ318_014628 [Aromia moschata]
MPLNERDRIEILMMIGVGDRMRTQQEVCRLFHEMHPDREPVSQSTVSRIERKYRELGHVRDAPRQGRPKINENVQQDVILSALENPHCTVRQVSRDLNIGKSSVSNIFKKVKYHPYRVRLIHELAEDDFDRRTEFCEYMMDHNNQNNGFIANILFSDEATFFLNGHVNRQNTRYWSQENPHWMQEYHTQHPQKVNVWAGIVRNRIAIITAEVYRNLMAAYGAKPLVWQHAKDCSHASDLAITLSTINHDLVGHLNWISSACVRLSKQTRMEPHERWLESTAVAMTS